MPFSSLGLHPAILESLAQQNYSKPFPIQELTIPAVIQGKDVLGIAKTGSGKTASYVLPILTNLQKKKELKNRFVNALIVVPTRELAAQVLEVIKDFSGTLPVKLKPMAVFGGVSINPQMKGMFGVNILVATPGRLLELVEHKAVHLGEIETLVLDEADKMLNLGFKEEMNRIFALLPKKRQNLLFSATLSKDVNNITQLILNNPEVVKIAEEEDNIDLIKQTAYHVSEERKGPFLRYLIKKHDLKQVLIFASSTYKADNIADKLRKNGIDAQAMHSKKSQGARRDYLDAFKRGQLRVLVATDLLSRGIDIEELPNVINYELPRSPKDYVHRIGRTGRAEAMGEAISLITPEEEHHFKIIQKKMKKEVETIPTEEINLHGF
ncbi:MAG: ATP-dependent RNA helicase RhlE [Sphingobacteriales bacterium]|jgi:ATP-dependent RNA helicase RhlE